MPPMRKTGILMDDNGRTGASQNAPARGCCLYITNHGGLSKRCLRLPSSRGKSGERVIAVCKSTFSSYSSTCIIPSMKWTSSRNRSSVAQIAIMALRPGGLRIASCTELKPPGYAKHPDAPVRPFLMREPGNNPLCVFLFDFRVFSVGGVAFAAPCTANVDLGRNKTVTREILVHARIVDQLVFSIRQIFEYSREPLVQLLR